MAMVNLDGNINTTGIWHCCGEPSLNPPEEDESVNQALLDRYEAECEKGVTCDCLDKIEETLSGFIIESEYPNAAEVNTNYWLRRTCAESLLYSAENMGILSEVKELLKEKF